MPSPHVKVNRCLLTLHAAGRTDSNNAAHTQASVHQVHTWTCRQSTSAME